MANKSSLVGGDGTIVFIVPSLSPPVMLFTSTHCLASSRPSRRTMNSKRPVNLKWPRFEDSTSRWSQANWRWSRLVTEFLGTVNSISTPSTAMYE